MSASIRFLGFAVLAWAGVRAASLGLLPGTQSLAPTAAAATIPAPGAAVGRSEAASLGPMASPAGPPPAYPPNAAYGPYGPYGPYAGFPGFAPYPGHAPQPYARPVAIPFYYPVPAVQPRAAAARTGSAWDDIGPPIHQSNRGWDVVDATADTRLAGIGGDPMLRPPQSSPIPGPAGAPTAARFDRMQLSAWALLRGSWGPGALATGGTLGGSQVGARLTYHFSPSLAASLRSSSSVGGVRYAEVAAGVRWKPLANVPVALNLERRQALNRWGGRNAFALFAEGGLYQTPIFDLANLDLYAQGGVVGLKSRDLFFDAGATFTRPLWKRFSAGVGVWGGMQPGLYRVDAGPRLSYDVGRGIRVHADYRQRLAGEAMPSSGPALTIAGDF